MCFPFRGTLGLRSHPLARGSSLPAGPLELTAEGGAVLAGLQTQLRYWEGLGESVLPEVWGWSGGGDLRSGPGQEAVSHRGGIRDQLSPLQGKSRGSKV